MYIYMYIYIYIGYLGVSTGYIRIPDTVKENGSYNAIWSFPQTGVLQLSYSDNRDLILVVGFAKAIVLVFQAPGHRVAFFAFSYWWLLENRICHVGIIYIVKYSLPTLNPKPYNPYSATEHQLVMETGRSIERLRSLGEA